MVIESLLLAVTRVSTMVGEKRLTAATGFFFERDDKLFLVTNRHVVLDEASNHRPDRLQIELHVDPDNVSVTTGFAIPLYQENQPVWRQGVDSAGSIDVVVIELDHSALPGAMLFKPFTPANLVETLDEIEVGTQVLKISGVCTPMVGCSAEDRCHARYRTPATNSPTVPSAATEGALRCM